MHSCIAVKGIILYKNKIIILEKELNNKNSVWDLPGGLIENDETELVALVREIKEELNIDIEVEKKVGVWHFIRHYDNKTVSVTNYLCSLKRQKLDIKLSNEHVAFKWIYPMDIVNYKTKDTSLSENILEYFGNSSA